MSRLVPNIELQGRAERDGGVNQWLPGQPIVTGTRRGVLTNSEAGNQSFNGAVATTGTWTKPSNLSPNSTTRVILVGPGGGAGAGYSHAGTTLAGGAGGGGGSYIEATYLT